MNTENAKKLYEKQAAICILQQQMIDCFKEQEKIFAEESTSDKMGGNPMLLAIAFMISQTRKQYTEMMEPITNNLETYKHLIEISEMDD